MSREEHPIEILLSTRQWDVFTVSALAKELEYDGLELVMQPGLDYSLIAKKREELQIKTIHAPMYDEEVDTFERGLREAVALAERLEVQLINIHPAPLRFGGRSGVERGIELIRKLSDEHEITIVYEVLPYPNPDKPKHMRYKAYETLQDWCLDVTKHQQPATIDTTHIGSYGEDLAAYVTKLGRLLRHVHVSDYSPETKEQHLFPGDGNLQLESFLEEVRKHNQHEVFYVTLEPATRFDPVDNKEKLRSSLAMMRKALG